MCVHPLACARAPVYEYPEGISATCTCSQQQTHVCEFHVCLTMLLAWLCLSLPIQLVCFLFDNCVLVPSACAIHLYGAVCVCVPWVLMCLLCNARG